MDVPPQPELREERAVRKLRPTYLIRKANAGPGGHVADESTYRLNLFACDVDPDEPTEEVGQKKAYVGQKLAYRGVGQKKARGRPNLRPGVGRKLAPQETVQETEQETAAAEKPGADAELVSVLVRKGVFPEVAVRLAREKPDQCRRCLAWLPHSKPRTTPGRWLANAIEHDFGPPEELQQRPPEAQEVKRLTAAKLDGPQVAQAERGEEIASRLRGRYTQLFSTRPDAITAFEAFFGSERDKATKYAASLSEKGRSEFERNAATEEFRLSIFERWVRGEGRGYLASKPERVEASTVEEGKNPVVTVAA